MRNIKKLSLLLCLFSLLFSSLAQADFTVNTEEDFSDGNLNNLGCAGAAPNQAKCSLRAAIEQANSQAPNPNGVIIRFNNTIQTITLASPITVSKKIIVQGNGRNFKIKSSAHKTLFIIDGASADLSLQSLILQGTTTDENLEESAILNRKNLALDGVTCASFKAVKGACIFNEPTGIISLINNSIFKDNVATEKGGAIYNEGALTRIVLSKFIENNVSPQANDNITYGGGAIYTDMILTAKIESSIFYMNKVSLNSNSSEGGAIYVTSDINRPSSLIINNTIFFFNSSKQGSAIYRDKLTIKIAQSSIIDNPSEEGALFSILVEGDNTQHFTISESVLSQKMNAESGNDTPLCRGKLTSAGSNFIDRNEENEQQPCVFHRADNDIYPEDALTRLNPALSLKPLPDLNVKYPSPLAGSPLIQALPFAYTYTTDASGSPRDNRSKSDMGAIQSHCGDGVNDGEPWEQCDPAIDENCTATCTLINGDPGENPSPVCGNNKLEFGEKCDDGNQLPADGCSADCTFIDAAPQITCGNGIVDTGELCDDGNQNSGDTCSADCTHQTPIVVNPDGNTNGSNGGGGGCSINKAQTAWPINKVLLQVFLINIMGLIALRQFTEEE